MTGSGHFATPGLKMLATLIRSHPEDRRVWSVLRLPTLQQEDARRPHGEPERLGQERTAHMNRIRALLVVHNEPVKYVGGACGSAGVRLKAIDTHCTLSHTAQSGAS